VISAQIVLGSFPTFNHQPRTSGDNFGAVTLTDTDALALIGRPELLRNLADALHEAAFLADGHRDTEPATALESLGNDLADLVRVVIASPPAGFQGPLSVAVTAFYAYAIATARLNGEPDPTVEEILLAFSIDPIR